MSTQTEPKDQHRSCPRCRAEVVAERHDVGTVRTYLWRCECGWTRAISESGVVVRRGLLAEVEAARKRRPTQP
jgi:ribosomal protein S27AE